MFPKTRQKAWISDLPGLAKGGEISFETLPISFPKSETRSFGFTILDSKELVSQLQLLSKSRTKIPKLSLVVRVDATKEVDNQYLMTGAMIDSVLPMKELPNAYAASIIFDSISAKVEASVNPGPPVNAPNIQSTGTNPGWIFGLPGEDVKSRNSIEVVEFRPPHYDRRLIVVLENPSSEIQNLIKNPMPASELILVLPDRTTQCYVEFKLWDSRVIMREDKMEIVFESDMIECLTGEEDQRSDDQRI